MFQGQAISRICLTTRKVYEDGYHDNPTPPEVVNSILNFTNNCYQKSCLTYGGESGDSFSSYSAFEEGDYNLFMTNLSSTAYYPLEKEDLDNSSTRYTIISQVKTTSGRQIVAHDTGMGGVDRYYQQ